MISVVVVEVEEMTVKGMEALSLDERFSHPYSNFGVWWWWWSW